MANKNRIFSCICTAALTIASIVCVPKVYAEPSPEPSETPAEVSPSPVTSSEPSESPSTLSEDASGFIDLVNAIDATNAEEVANTYASLLAQSLGEEQPEDLEEQFAAAEVEFDPITIQIQQAQDAYNALSEEDKEAPEVASAFASLTSLATTIQAIIDAAYSGTPVGVPAPMATGIHFTSLEIHEGSVTGPLVVDLMTHRNFTLENGQLYFIVGNADKDSSSDDTWMSITFPWYCQPTVMPGDTNWKTTGATFAGHPTFDKVELYTPASPGASVVAPTDAGTVQYHIMNGTGGSSPVLNAGFELGFKVAPDYYDGKTGGQVWTSNKFIFSVGDEGVATSVDTIQSVTTKVTGTQTAQQTQITSANTSTGATATSSNNFGVGNSNATGPGVKMVWTNIECDLVYPTAYTPSISSLTYGGVTLTPGATTTSGTNTIVHYSGAIPAGSNGTGFTCSASFPAPEEVKNMQIKNIEITPYGDEDAARVVTGSASLQWNVSNAPADVSLANQSLTRYDWFGQENIKANTLIGEAVVTNTTAANSVDPYTLKVTTATNATVREIVVPLYEGHGDTIKINGTTYNIDDISWKEQMISYPNYNVAVITTDALGLTEDDTISTIEYEMGIIPGNYKSREFGTGSSDRPKENHIALYGSINDGNNAVSDFEIYKTASGAPGFTATGTGIPTAEKKIGYYSDDNRVNLGGTGTSIKGSSCQAGNSIDIIVSPFITPWVEPITYDRTSASDYDASFYIIVPAGMSLKESSVTLGGEAVTPIDVTATATGVPAGVTIYRVQDPTPEVTGGYKTDGTEKDPQLRFTLNTSPSTTTTTYQLKDIVQIGTGPDAIAAGHSATYSNNFSGTTPMTDTYGLNDGKSLVGLVASFSLTPTQSIVATNTLNGTSNTDPLGTDLVFDPANPTTTRLTVENGYAATYKVDLANRIGTAADNVQVFIPVAKDGQNFGSAFNPAGAQTFDLTLTESSVESGWSVQYIKMRTGFTLVKGTQIVAADYSPATGPDDADMILITKDAGSWASLGTAHFEFDVASGDLSLNDGDIDTWYCMTQYSVGPTDYSDSLYQESMIVRAPLTPVEVDPPVEKIVTGGTLPAGTTFEFKLEAISTTVTGLTPATMPMPTGSTAGVKVMTEGAGSHEFGNIEFTQAGTYNYKITETAGTNPLITYDSTVYEIEIVVTNNAGTLEAVKNVDKTDASGTTTTNFADGVAITGITFTNNYDAPPAPGGSDSWLVTFLDCYGNTVKIEWVPSGGSATPPTGFGTYSGYTNVTSHRDLTPGDCSITNKWRVPPTGVE